MFGTRQRSHRPYRLAALVLIAVILVGTALWAAACARLDRQARAAIAASGWTLQSGATRWSGWPAAAEVTLPDTVLRSGPDIIPPLTWTAPRAVLRLSAWRPTVLTAAASGVQTLAIGVAPPVPFQAKSLAAAIDLTARDPVRIAASSLEVSAPNGPVTIDAATLLLVPDALSADLAGLTLPGHAGQPIAPPIDRLHVDGQVTPPIEPQPTAAETAQRWRDARGRLDLTAVSLRWGPLDATAHGTLTLDQALQPAVTAQVTATGLAAVIDQFAQTGAVTRSSATAAQAMLAILSAPSGGGPVTLPVTLQDGVVAIARIPLLRLAPLAWD